MERTASLRCSDPTSSRTLQCRLLRRGPAPSAASVSTRSAVLEALAQRCDPFGIDAHIGVANPRRRTDMHGVVGPAKLHIVRELEAAGGEFGRDVVALASCHGAAQFL